MHVCHETIIKYGALIWHLSCRSGENKREHRETTIDTFTAWFSLEEISQGRLHDRSSKPRKRSQICKYCNIGKICNANMTEVVFILYILPSTVQEKTTSLSKFHYVFQYLTMHQRTKWSSKHCINLNRVYLHSWKRIHK